jgi:glycosyltransferase involved in cell wall biosynthesis
MQTLTSDITTPLILTFNEEPNIARTLSKLQWANRIVVVDSFSTDDTCSILASDVRVEVYKRAFDTHARQWNFGLSKIKTPWVLTLDADYVLSDEFMSWLNNTYSSSVASGYRVAFRYCINGTPLKGTVLPSRIVLFKTKCGSYVDDGHTQDLMLVGPVGESGRFIYHDDRKALSRWLWAQNRYISLETRKLLSTPVASLSLADRIRLLHIVAPVAIFLMCYVWNRNFINGRLGLFYSLQRSYVELLLSLSILDARINSRFT